MGHLENISPSQIYQVLLTGEKLGSGGDCLFGSDQNFLVNSGEEIWDFIFKNEAKIFKMTSHILFLIKFSLQHQQLVSSYKEHRVKCVDLFGPFIFLTRLYEYMM